MGKQEPGLGAKVRGLRRQRGLTQVELARRLDISPSYLNLIEHEQRSLTAPLLLRLAQEFDLDLQDFASNADDQLQADLMEAFGDPVFGEHEVGQGEIRELVAGSPALAQSILTLFRSFRDARETVNSLASQIYDDQQVPGVGHRSPLATEEVSDFIQRHNNHFPELEEASARLLEEAQLRPSDMHSGLIRYLNEAHGIDVVETKLSRDEGTRRYDPERGRLLISDMLPATSRSFELAAQVAHVAHAPLLETLSSSPGLSSPQSRALCRVVLANYFASAVIMPYDTFLETARSERYDIELLGHRFGASFEQVCHRLASLRRSGAEGVPFHMIRVDLAGNISKRFSASGIRFARFAGGCPRWNVFSAFLTPGQIRTQLSVMSDGDIYFCIARTVPKGRGGYHTPHTVQAIGLGCQLRFAKELVYSDGIDLEHTDKAIPVGVTCRLCDRRDCEQRAFPSIRQPIEVDENIRGPSFYAPNRDR